MLLLQEAYPPQLKKLFVQVQKDDSGKRYGNPVLDFVRELNRYLTVQECDGKKSIQKSDGVEDNKIEKVKFQLPDVAHTFKKGHRLMIQIQSSWFPLADRNPQIFVNIYEASISDYKKATIRIFHDADNSSNIVLPVLK